MNADINEQKAKTRKVIFLKFSVSVQKTLQFTCINQWCKFYTFPKLVHKLLGQTSYIYSATQNDFISGHLTFA